MKNKPKNGVVVGIDLGTTFSVVSIYESDKSCKIVPNADGDLLTPSVVNLRDEKNVVVGRAAVHQSAFVPEYMVRRAQRPFRQSASSPRPD